MNRNAAVSNDVVRATQPRGIKEKLARVDWAKRDVLIVNVPDEAGNYVFKVDKWRQLPQLIAASEFGVASVAYTNLFLLENSTAYPELHLRSEAEYRFYSELKRRVKDVDYRSEDVSGFEFAGKKIVFEGGEIQLMDGKRNPVTIKVREFERRPNAEFRRGDGVCGEEYIKLVSSIGVYVKHEDNCEGELL